MYDIMIGSTVWLTVTDEGFAERLVTDLRDAQKAGLLFQLDGQRIAAVSVDRGQPVAYLDVTPLADGLLAGDVLAWPAIATAVLLDDADEG